METMYKKEETPHEEYQLERKQENESDDEELFLEMFTNTFRENWEW